MLTGTSEDMKRIEAAGQLDEWCADSLKWLQETFGKDNVVSAELHRDEKTPHIHATVVPIVSGERRTKPTNKPPDPNKRTYRKKPANTVRLCADDAMTRKNLERFQDTYAEAMDKYGLERGIRGSEARHITTPQYSRDLHAKNEDLKEDIADLEERKQEVNDKIRNMYDHRDEAKEKFLAMHEFNKQKESEIADKEQRLEQLQRDYEPYKGQEDLNLLLAILPTLGENLRMAQLCNGVGLTVEATKTLFRGETVSYTGKLHSPEHDRDFEVQDAKLQILKESGEPNEPNKYRLSLNGQNIIYWFREQFQKLRQVFRPSIRQAIIQPQQGKGRGVG
jgi:hypothetical protein